MIQTRAHDRRRTRRVSLAAGLAVGALLLSGCSSEGEGPSSGGANFVQGDGSIERAAPEDRVPAPRLTGESTHGEELDLADYRGQVVVLNVWGSWCAPCRAEAPHLARVSEETADEDVQFLGINTRDATPENAIAFDERFGIEYPSFYDPKGRMILEFPENTLSPQAIPTTLVLDREGNIAVRALAALSYDELRDALDPVLEEDR